MDKTLYKGREVLKNIIMKVSVYDTYVPKGEHAVMHFDILVEENTNHEKVYEYGKRYLKSKGIGDSPLTTKECNFCHIEIASNHVKDTIVKQGYYIIEMENCN